MNREIKFRGRAEGDWLFGDLTHVLQMMYVDQTLVEQDTIGQFTGLYDKNGKEIYEGDIVKYFKAEIYSDLLCYDPLFYQHEHRIKEYQSVVEYRYGCIMVENDYLYGAAFESIEQAMECLGIDECCEPCDCEGTEVNESIIGYEIIGNIHDNPELIKE